MSVAAPGRVSVAPESPPAESTGAAATREVAVLRPSASPEAVAVALAALGDDPGDADLIRDVATAGGRWPKGSQRGSSTVKSSPFSIMGTIE
jgi:hypothetical protein